MDPIRNKKWTFINVLKVALIFVLIVSVIIISMMFAIPTKMTCSLDRYAKVGDPGESVDFLFTVELEDGLRYRTLRIQNIASLSGWNLSVDATDITISSGEVKTVTFTVEVPHDISGTSQWESSDIVDFNVVEETLNSRTIWSMQFIVYSSSNDMSETWANEDNSDSPPSFGSISAGIFLNPFSIFMMLIFALTLIALIIIFVKEALESNKKRMQ